MPSHRSFLPPGNHHLTLEFSGRVRDFLVHVPPSCDGSSPVATILAFHGAGSNAQFMIEFCGLAEKADEAGFVVVFPNGTGRAEGMYTWNAGHCCGHAERNQEDDVGFVRALLDELGRLVNVDPQRVYAAGMSNGGMMSYRLADEVADRFAAICSVGGPMGDETCRPARPVPVIHFHGTDDLFAPYGGGYGERSISRIDFYSVQHTIDNWVRANGCDPAPVVTRLVPAIDDGTSVEQRVYGNGKEGSEVVLHTIAAAGHTWPGREPSLKFLGRSTKNLNANDLIWDFFQRHPRANSSS